MKQSVFFAFLFCFCRILIAQNNNADLIIYEKALNEIKSYKQYHDYLIWATSEDSFVSDEILFSNEVLNVCSKCVKATNEGGTGVKEKLVELKVAGVGESKVIIFFTEIFQDCFTIILKTSFNDDFSYEEGVFIGKQLYFQFIVKNDTPEICSRMLLDTH